MADGEKKEQVENNPYTSSYVAWKGWGNLFTPTPKEIRTFEEECHGISLKDKRVLEIGFGAGSFMSWAKERGATVSGCELIEDLCSAGISKGYDTRFGGVETFAEEAGMFDLIVGFDVMEHIDPSESVEFMRSLRYLLKDEGRFLARVPNGASPWGMAYQHGDISHVNALSSGKFQQLAYASGMKLLYCRNAVRLHDPDSKFMDMLRYFFRDLIERVISSAYGLDKGPMDPNIVACFEPNVGPEKDQPTALRP